MSQYVNEIIAGACVLGAYAGACVAIFNHHAGARLPLARYAVGGAIALGGLTALSTDAVAAEPSQAFDKAPISAPAVPVARP